jgi:hypothetical protein
MWRKEMKTIVLFLVMVFTAMPNAHALYGRRPIEAILRDNRVSIVDATVEELTAEGFAKIKTNEILKGKTSPEMLKGFFISVGRPLKERLKEKKRYIFVIKGDEIYESTTFWEVLKSFDGELMCHYYRYKSAPGLKNDSLPVLAASGLHKLSDFKKWIKRVIEEASVSSHK